MHKNIDQDYQANDLIEMGAVYEESPRELAK